MNKNVVVASVIKRVFARLFDICLFIAFLLICFWVLSLY